MHEDLLRRSRRLPQYSAIRVSGPDAKAFLQGQLSADIESLQADSVLLASCNSAQGRVQAVLWILERGDELVLVTATELAEATVARLRKYVLRAKVKFEPATLNVYGAPLTERSPTPWSAPLSQHYAGDINSIQWPGGRTLLIAPSNDERTDESFTREWHLADIRAGVPLLHTQTHESFVAQMLNLDLLGGISFQKGCYTGQEIIARTHYRGSVKRRMLRYASNEAAPQPGTRILSGTEAAGEVVTAEATSEGCELLAVMQLSHVEQDVHLDGSSVALKRLPLPYEVPTGA